MSGRHKPLMHVIFLFPPAISPAFPHRSLLSPSRFKNGIYFCLKNHALSLLIQRVRLHWDSKHTSSLSKLDIHFFSPTRRYLLANQVWLGVVTSRGSFRGSLQALDRSYWSSQPDCRQEETAPQCTHSTELRWRQSWVQFLWITPSDKAFPRGAGSASSSTSSPAPICPALKASSCRRHVLGHNKPAQQFCSAPRRFCQIYFASSAGSQGYFSRTTSFSPLQILSS